MMEEKVYKAIKKSKKGIKAFTLESHLENDLAFDSLDMLMLISELEDEFGVNIDESHFAEVETVADIVEKLKAAGIC